MKVRIPKNAGGKAEDCRLKAEVVDARSIGAESGFRCAESPCSAALQSSVFYALSSVFLLSQFRYGTVPSASVL